MCLAMVHIIARGEKTREKGKNKVGWSSESTAHRLLQREGERHRGEEGDPTLPLLHNHVHLLNTMHASPAGSPNLLPFSRLVTKSNRLRVSIPLTSLTYLPDPPAHQPNLLNPPSPPSHYPNKEPASFFSFSFFPFFSFLSSFKFYVAILHLIPRLMPSSFPLYSLYSFSYPFIFPPSSSPLPKPAKSKAPRSLDPATRMTSLTLPKMCGKQGVGLEGVR